MRYLTRQEVQDTAACTRLLFPDMPGGKTPRNAVFYYGRDGAVHFAVNVRDMTDIDGTPVFTAYGVMMEYETRYQSGLTVCASNILDYAIHFPGIRFSLYFSCVPLMTNTLVYDWDDYISSRTSLSAVREILTDTVEGVESEGFIYLLRLIHPPKAHAAVVDTLVTTWRRDVNHMAFKLPCDK